MCIQAEVARAFIRWNESSHLAVGRLGSRDPLKRRHLYMERVWSAFYGMNMQSIVQTFYMVRRRHHNYTSIEWRLPLKYWHDFVYDSTASLSDHKRNRNIIWQDFAIFSSIWRFFQSCHLYYVKIQMPAISNSRKISIEDATQGLNEVETYHASEWNLNCTTRWHVKGLSSQIECKPQPLVLHERLAESVYGAKFREGHHDAEETTLLVADSAKNHKWYISMAQQNRR